MTKKPSRTDGVKARPATSYVRTYQADGAVFEDSLSEFFDVQIARAILRDKAISFDWIVDHDEVEAVQLTSQDGINFSGRSINSPGTKWEYSARVEAVIYSNAKGHVVIAQSVYDDGQEES